MNFEPTELGYLLNLKNKKAKKQMVQAIMFLINLHQHGIQRHGIG